MWPVVCWILLDFRSKKVYEGLVLYMLKIPMEWLRMPNPVGQWPPLTRSFLITCFSAHIYLHEQVCCSEWELWLESPSFGWWIIVSPFDKFRTYLGAQTVKNPPAMQETWVQSLGGKIPWRRKWQPSPIFLWEIPWTEEPGLLQSVALKRVRHSLATNTFHFHLW